MWPYYPDLLAQPVPRYTSYPPATAFTPQVGAAEQAEALRGIAADTPLSLYLHIPYCQSICWYCGCNTGLAGKAQRLNAYLEALEVEIALVAGLLDGRGQVRQIAFGGGSPNAIAPVAFVRLVDQISSAFGVKRAELSVEIDPRAFSADWAAALGQKGVSRVSFGVQSFDPEIQAAIGRVQPVEMVANCVAMLRQHGVRSINFDLMHGLPLQTADKLAQTIDAVLAPRPERIALYGYAHLPAMFPRQRRIDDSALPDAKQRFELAALGHDQLVAAGYRAIGFDHFALPQDCLAIAHAEGRLHRNFQGFSDDASTTLIGFGASAISTFPDRIIQNEKNIGNYRAACSSGQLAGARGVMRSAADAERARVIEGILCHGKAHVDEVLLSPAIRANLAPLVERELLCFNAEGVRLASAALPYARHIAAAFDAQFTAH